MKRLFPFQNLILTGCVVAVPPGPPTNPQTDSPPSSEQYASSFRFEAIDVNRDARISLSEFLDANHAFILNNPQRDTQDFQAHDRDRDGFMNRQEHALWYAKLLASLGMR